MTRRALLIGYGSIGAKRARILRDFGWELTIWEPQALRRLAARADGFTDVAPPQVWNRRPEADVAFVCSPPKYHANNVGFCLDHGSHVFIEKPIAHTLEDAKRICDAAAASDRHVMVGCNYRFALEHPWQPNDIRCVQIELSYRIAEARPDWRNSYVNDLDQGGIVLDSGIHAIDLAAHLAGPIARIHHTAAHQPGKLGGLVEDVADIQLVHKNGIVTDIDLSWTSKRVQHEVRFLTKTGHRWLSNLWDGTDKMFERETREFLRCVQKGKAPPNGPEEATETLRWCIEARDMVRGELEVKT